MKKRSQRKLLSASMMTALGAGSLAVVDAHAGSYVGGAIGEALLRSDSQTGNDYVADALTERGLTLTNPSSHLSGTNFDTRGFGWRAYYGYKFIPQLAVEAEYADLGKGASHVRGLVDGPEGVSGSHEVKKSGYGVAVIGFLPLHDKWSVFARFGGLHWTAKSTSDVSIPNLQPSRVRKETSNSSTNGHYGFGFEREFGKRFGGRLEWAKYYADGSDTRLYLVDGFFRF
ncbi:MAG: outer membrane beta-barrel protein [Acidobacteria bacterium]|nr:outer membrane beta-barrel protein [Acidobacteriota bacterium]